MGTKRVSGRHGGPTLERVQTDRAFFGHPKAIGTLGFMQLCWNFGRFGMSSLLIYYLYGSAPDGLGLSRTDASQLVSLYYAASVVCGIVGSIVADRILGPRRALLASRVIETAGYAALAIPALGVGGYAASQVLLCSAAMVAGRSSEALAGKLYARRDDRRDRAFNVIYIIQNIGCVSPLLVGMLAQSAGYGVGFGACALVSAAGALSLALTDRRFFGPVGLLPDDPMPRARRRPFVAALALGALAVVVLGAALLASGSVSVAALAEAVSVTTVVVPIAYLAVILRSPKTTREECRRVMGWIPLFVCNCLTFLVWMQGTTTLSVYAEQVIDRNLWGFEPTPTAFQTLPGLLAIAWGAAVGSLWRRLGGRSPGVTRKFGVGTVIWGAGALYMCLPLLLFGTQGHGFVAPGWLVGFYVVIILGEAITFSSGWALSSAIAPVAFSTQMVTVWGLSQSTGSALNALAVRLYQPGSEVAYFAVLGTVVVAAGAVLVALAPRLARLMALEARKAGREGE